MAYKASQSTQKTLENAAKKYSQTDTSYRETSSGNKATSSNSSLNKATFSSMSDSVYKQYEKDYNYWQKTGNHTDWYNKNRTGKDVDTFKKIKGGKGKSALSNGTYYYMDNDTYDKYGRDYNNWKNNGNRDYGDTSWRKREELDAFKLIRSSRNNYENSFDDFRYSLNDDVIKATSEKYKKQWGDKYYYDMNDPEDVSRMANGQMPKYLEDKYDLGDVYSKFLYDNNLPYNITGTNGFSDMYSEAYNDWKAQEDYNINYNNFLKETASKIQNATEEEIAPVVSEILTSGNYDDVAKNFRKKASEGDEWDDIITNYVKEEKSGNKFDIDDIIRDIAQYMNVPKAQAEQVVARAIDDGTVEEVVEAVNTAKAEETVDKAVTQDDIDKYRELADQKANVDRRINEYDKKKKQHSTFSGYEEEYNELKAEQARLEAEMNALGASQYSLEQNKANAYLNKVNNSTDISMEPVSTKGWDNENAAFYNAITGVNDYSHVSTDIFNSMKNLAKYCTSEEIGVLNTVAKGGEEPAKEYMNNLKTVLQARSMEADAEKYQQFAEDNGVLSSIASVPMSVAGSLEGIGNIGNNILGNRSATQSMYNGYLTRASDNIRTTVSEEIQNEYNDELVGGVTTGEAISLLYQTGLSMAETLARMPMGYAGLALAGGSAASSTMIEQLENGASLKQATILSSVAGAAEVVTEKVSLESLFKAKSAGNLGQLLGNVAKQMFVEGSEEVSSDIINTIADNIVRGDYNSIRQEALEYMKNNPGVSLEQAEGIVFGKNVAVSFIGGAISGGVMGAGGQAINIARTNGGMRTINALNKNAISPEVKQNIIKNLVDCRYSNELTNNVMQLVDEMDQNPSMIATKSGTEAVQKITNALEEEANKLNLSRAENTIKQQKAQKRLNNLLNTIREANNMARHALEMGDKDGYANRYVPAVKEAIAKYNDEAETIKYETEKQNLKEEQDKKTSEKKIADVTADVAENVGAMKQAEADLTANVVEEIQASNEQNIEAEESMPEAETIENSTVLEPNNGILEAETAEDNNQVKEEVNNAIPDNREGRNAEGETLESGQTVGELANRSVSAEEQRADLSRVNNGFSPVTEYEGNYEQEVIGATRTILGKDIADSVCMYNRSEDVPKTINGFSVNGRSYVEYTGNPTDICYVFHETAHNKSGIRKGILNAIKDTGNYSGILESYKNITTDPDVEAKTNAEVEEELLCDVFGAYALYRRLSVPIDNINGVLGMTEAETESVFDAVSEMLADGVEADEDFDRENAIKYSTNELDAKYNESVQNGNVGRNFRKDRATSGPMAYFTSDQEENQIKSADPISYDRNGNIIPLSQRFSDDTNDIYYSSNDLLKQYRKANGTEERSSIQSIAKERIQKSENSIANYLVRDISNTFNIPYRSVNAEMNEVRKSVHDFVEAYSNGNMDECADIAALIGKQIMYNTTASGISEEVLNMVGDEDTAHFLANEIKNTTFAINYHDGEKTVGKSIRESAKGIKWRKEGGVYLDDWWMSMRSEHPGLPDMDEEDLAPFLSKFYRAYKNSSISLEEHFTNNVNMMGSLEETVTGMVYQDLYDNWMNKYSTEYDIITGNAPIEKKTRDRYAVMEAAGKREDRKIEILQEADSRASEIMTRMDASPDYASKYVRDYVLSDEYNPDVARQMMADLRRNGYELPGSGRLSEARLKEIVDDSIHWKSQKALAIKEPGRVFEDTAAWRDVKRLKGVARDVAEIQNSMASSRLYNTYFGYLAEQEQKRNMFMERAIERVKKWKVTPKESALAQLLGEKLISEDTLKKSISNDDNIIVPMNDGAMVLDKKGRIVMLADGERLIQFDDNEFKKLADRDRKIKEINTDGKGNKAERINELLKGSFGRETKGEYRLISNGNNYSIVNEKGETVFSMNGTNVSNTANIIGLKNELVDLYKQMFGMVQYTLVTNGYERIRKRKNYFSHMRVKADGIRGALEFLKADNLNVDVYGLTSEFTPGKTWSGHLLERTGSLTDYDAVEGFNRYLKSVSDVIFMTPVIQRNRQLENSIRTGEISKTADTLAVNNNNANFAAWLHEYTNGIANKKSQLDRGAELLANRKIYGIMNKAMGITGTSQIAFNFKTGLTNLAAFAQGSGMLNPKYTIQGVWDVISGAANNDGLDEELTFLKNRLNAADTIETSKFNKTMKAITSAGFAWMQAVDGFSTRSVARGKFHELMEKGYSRADALEETSKWCLHLFADRSKGAKPVLFNSKTLGMFTQFQLEPLNQMYHWKDIHKANVRESINEAIIKNGGKFENIDLNELAKEINRSYIAKKDVSKVLGRILSLSLYGLIMRLLTGRDATWNPLGIAYDVVKGAKNNGAEGVRGALYDDIADNIAFGSYLNFVDDKLGNILSGESSNSYSNSPIPVVSAIDTAASSAKNGNALGILGAAASFVPGGAQAKKTVQGITAVAKGGKYKSNGNLQYPIEQNGFNYVKGALFGPSSFKPSDYEKALSKSQTEFYENLVGLGSDQNEAYEAAKNFKNSSNLDLVKSILESGADGNALMDAYDVKEYESYNNFDKYAKKKLNDAKKSGKMEPDVYDYYMEMLS